MTERKLALIVFVASASLILVGLWMGWLHFTWSSPFQESPMISERPA